MGIEVNKINPYVRRAITSCLSKNTQIPRRVIFDYELVYIEKGNFELEYDGKFYNIGENTFVFIRPNIRHAFYIKDEDLVQPHIHFDLVYSENSAAIPISFKDRDDLTAFEQMLMQTDVFGEYPQNPVITLKNSKAKKLFYKIITAEDKTSLTVKALMVQLIDLIIAENFAKSLLVKKENYTISKQIKDLLDSGQGFDLGLEDFEKRFSYSRYYLERQFKSEFGISLIAYRNQKRMGAAKELLSEFSVTAVAEKLGFQSIYAFSNAFKKQYGKPPSSVKL